MKFFKLVGIFAITFLVISCKKEPKNIDINKNELLQNVKILSNDSMEGRAFTTSGNEKAKLFIIQKFKEIGINPLNADFEQPFTVTLKGKQRQAVFPIDKPGDDLQFVRDTTVSGANVLGVINGQTNKTIVITAHFDHLGIQKGFIFNGADDNASGVSALLEIARYFKTKSIKHNLVLAAVDAQEAGSLGAQHFIDTFPNKKDIVLNINMDMISHSDFDPEIFVCGTYHNPDLKDEISNIVTKDIKVLFGHDDPYNREQFDWTFISDHRVFHREKIPFLYFGVEDHKDYHKPTDTFDTINQEFYIEVVKVIIQTIENLDQYFFEENR